MEKKYEKALLAKYAAGECTPEEKAIIESWYVQHQHEDFIDIGEKERLDDMAEIRGMLIHEIRPKSSSFKHFWPRVLAAASILLILSVGFYVVVHRQAEKQQLVKNPARDFAPGSNKAILTLASGKQLVLTGAKVGLLANQGNTAIHVKSGDEVVYSANSGINPTQVQYNTMTTPRGGQYPLTLSDGTKAWLDAASSITFPVAFNGNVREVKITGQVYFEVAHDPARPFRVTAKGQMVEVLGTHFNISAYPNEPKMRTTLLEGSVRIAYKGQTALLKPGQQAVIDQTSRNDIDVKEVDTDEAVAWKDGYFMFHKADIGAMMRQLERWYDVDVAYEGQTPSAKITGKVHRNVNASQVLKILTYLDIHYKIEGKKIIITP